MSTTTDLNQRGKCKPCKEQGLGLCGGTAHDGMSDFHSLAERLGFSFCRYLFKRKHVCCLITAWHLTVFSDQSDKFFLFFMLAAWRSSNKEKTYSIVTFLKPFKGSLLPQLSTSDTMSAVLIFFFLSFVFIFLFFWTNLVCRDLIATIRAELKKKNHFPVSKVLTT